MSGNAEEGIARAQLEAAKAEGSQALPAHQQRTIVYLNERIIIFVLAIACVGLGVLWASATSPWLIYGSFAAVILLIVLWGWARIKRIEQIREQRARAAQNWQAQKPE